MDLDIAATLILRISYGGLFVFTAGTLCKGWSWTVANTAIMVGRQRATLFSLGAVCFMIAGGLSIVTGFYGQIGALGLIAFLILGTLLHRRERNMIPGFGTRIRQGAEGTHGLSPDADEQLTELTTSAFSAHVANVYKNLCLIGIAVFFVLHGTGSWSTDCGAFHLNEFFHTCVAGTPSR